MTQNIQKKFLQFHKENPNVWQLFKKYATQVKATGIKRYSAKCIMERIRWHQVVETTDPSFKINNNYTAYYARMIMKECLQFEGFFETRELLSERKDIYYGSNC